MICSGDTPDGVLEALKGAVGDPEVEFEVLGRSSESPETSFFSGETSQVGTVFGMGGRGGRVVVVV